MIEDKIMHNRVILITVIVAFFSVQVEAGFLDKLNEKLKEIENVKETIEHYAGDDEESDELSRKKSDDTNNKKVTQSNTSSLNKKHNTGQSKNSKKYNETYEGFHIIKSPYPDTFKPLILDQVGGKISGNYYPNRFKSNKNIQQIHLRKVAHSYINLYDLLQLKYLNAADIPSKVELKSLIPKSSMHYAKADGMSELDYKRLDNFMSFVHRLVSNLFNDTTYAHYMCKNSTCSRGELNRLKQRAGHWGGDDAFVGGGNPFVMRKRFHTFIDNELDKVIAYAKIMPDNFVVYRSMNVQTYSFNNRSLVVSGLKPIVGIIKPKQSEVRHYKPFKTYSSLDIPAQFGSSGQLILMNESKAETFLENYKSARTSLYYTYEIKLSPAYKRSPQFGQDPKHISLIYDIRSPSVTLYDGPSMKNKILTLPIKK